MLPVMFFLAEPVQAHHPYRHHQPQTPRFEPIPPLGNRLPPSYRRVYNRPRYLGGKLAYYLAPTSQEAMSWHEHAHRGTYRRHAGRIEPMYMYPKPWEVLTTGSRPAPPAENPPSVVPAPAPQVTPDAADAAPENLPGARNELQGPQNG